MESAILYNLEQTKKRLSYYSQLKEKSGDEPAPTIDKWIEIYSERIKKFEELAKDFQIEN